MMSDDAAIDGTPVLVVFLSIPVAKLESSVLLIPITVVAPPVDVLVASPVSVVKVPDPPHDVAQVKAFVECV